MVEDSSSLGTLITDEVYGWHTCRTIAITDLAPAKLLTGRLEALNQEISLRGWVETDRAVFERGHGGVPGSTRFTRIRICKGLI
jgi:hypothetical protein